MGSADRINGWKAIGAYFGRDRTTAIRWARDRDLPVHRLPGGKTATVYALTSELDQWARGQQTGSTPENASVVQPARIQRPSPRVWLIGAAAVLAVVAPMTAYLTRMNTTGQQSSSPALPSSPSVADAYMRARDLAGERSADALEEAIRLLQDVTRREPGFAPAYASLAEALLLSREFGMRSDREVFPRARTAARTAVRLDPGLAAAHRALGFIAYWSDHDRKAAGEAFRRAIELAPDQPLTHFWYGNVLADNGDHDDARRELDAARLGLPGSIAIQTDVAWAHWAAGDEMTATPALERIARDHPGFAVAHDCLSIIRLAKGDYAGYVAAFTAFAEARRDARLLAHARDLRAAQGQGIEAVRRLMTARAMADLEADGDRPRAWAAFIASVAGDRAGLLAVLRTAEDRHEVWGDSGLVRRIKDRWAGDAEVIGLLNRRPGPPVA